MRALLAVSVVALSLLATGCSAVSPEPSPSPSDVVVAPSLDSRPLQDQLVAAVLVGDAAVAALALDAGADPSEYDPESGNGPLSLAITRDDKAMVLLLVEAGATIEWPEFDYSELQIAGTFAGAEVTQTLLDAGANPDGIGARVGLPVFLAAYEGNLEALEVLLAAGADPNLFSEDAPRPAPPIFGAAYGGSTDAALMLIDAGADVTVRSPEGHGPADWADSQGHRELADLLRSLGG
jgi:ankyrin repeat protein